MFEAALTSVKSRMLNALETPPDRHIEQILAGTHMLVADVGAAGWLAPNWRGLERKLDVLLFEPHPTSYQELAESVKASPNGERITVLNVGLSGTGGRRTLHLTNRPTGSSLLPVNLDSEFVEADDPYFFPLSETQIETRTLAEVLDEQQASLHMVKLDTQGAEHEILSGLGAPRLRELVLVEAEVSISGGTYVGCPTPADIESLLAPAELRLYDVDIKRNFRKKHGNKRWYHEHVFDVHPQSSSVRGRLWEFDVMYFKDYQALMARGDVDQIRRLLVALCAYRFFIEAHFIVERCEQESLFDAAESVALKASIVAWHAEYARRPWNGTGVSAKAARYLLHRL